MRRRVRPDGALLGGSARATTAAAVAVGLLVAACGGPDQRVQAIDDLTVQLATAPAIADYGVGTAEAACAAEAVVDELGVARVEEIVGTDDDSAEREPGGTLRLDLLEEREVEVLATELATCIDAGPDADTSAVLAQAVADGVVASATEEFPVTDAEAGCIGSSVVDTLGVPDLLGLAIVADSQDIDLDGARTDAFVDAFLACTDVRGRVLAGVGAGEVDAEVLTCLDVAITDEQVAELFALGFAGDEASADRAAEVLAPAIDFCT